MPSAISESGFFSRYFLIPKRDGGLSPILDLRHLNHSLMHWSFKMLTIKQILAHICHEDWFLTVDLKDEYFHIHIAPHHRPFLRFGFEGVAYQYAALPFGLSLVPHTFSKCIDVALSPLRQMGIRILSYLDDWLVLARSERELAAQRELLLSLLECQMRAWITPEWSLAIQRLAASFILGTTGPLKVFQRLLGLMAAAASGPASHAAPSVLDSTWTVLQMSLLCFWTWEHYSCVGQRALRFHQKIS